MPLVVNVRLCTGCKTCELACSFAHGAPGLLPTTRVRVAKSEALHAPLLCLQCDSAACVAACATRALVRNPGTGAVELVEARCTRCEACVVGCPFGMISFSAAEGVTKCDLCRGNPACARFCPSGALSTAFGK